LSLDYTDFTDPKNPKSKKSLKKATDKQWWKADLADRAGAITAVVTQISDDDKLRQNQNMISMRLYGNMNLVGANGFGSARFPSAPLSQKDRLTYNVVQSAGDTVTAKIAKNKPKPMFLTSGGSYKLQRKAKKLDRFVEGVFYENDMPHMGPRIMTDAFVLGDGYLQVLARDGRVAYDRTLATELLVDWKESLYGNPRQMHRVKEYDRDVLIEMFPESEGKILMAKNYRTQINSNGESMSNQLTVAESWRLPSGKKAKDGVHSINILGGDSLINEEWTKSYFPFARLMWSPRQIGYWSQGGAEQIQSIQLEINKILWTIQESYRLAGSVKLWTQIGSKLVKEHVNNSVGAIWESDTRPEYIVPPVVPPEMYQALKDRKNDAFEQIGVSQLSASSQKPAGLDSGKALRTMNNIESERFMILGQSYEQFHLQLARMTVDCAREIDESTKGGYAVQSPNAKFVETIDWKDVALDDDDFIMKMFPTSSLANDPADRMQQIQEWVQAGWITPRTAKRIQDFPDLEAVEQLENAKEDYLHLVMEKILDDGEYTAPEPFDDLQLAKSLFLDYYAYAKCNGVEEDKLEMLRNFNEQVDVLIQKAMPPAPTAPGSMSPQASPMAPPQSDLIQNTPQAA
jgi:hypothetical protein